MLTVPFDHQSLHVMVKPIGPICNLDCEYCYYLHKEELYPTGEKWKMEDSLLEFSPDSGHRQEMSRPG